MKRGFRSILLVGLVLFLLFSIEAALAAANNVPKSGLTIQTVAITADQLKPAACASLTLVNIITNNTGTAQADLILGTAGNDNINNGGNGTDCIVGGAGNDTLNGRGGNDIILGGAGNDTITGGAGTDICYSGGGTDTFATCETILP